MSIPRNASCPCGSGKKYKQCCGRPGTTPPASTGTPEPARTAAPAAPSITARLAAADEHRRSGRTAAARAAYTAVLREAPKTGRALAALGELEHQLGNAEGGRAMLEKAVTLDAVQPGWWTALAHVRLAFGDVEPALAAADTAARLAPRSPAPQIMRAQILDRLRRSDEARAAADRAVQLAPQNGTALITLAALERKSGAFPEARARIEGALPALRSPVERRWAQHELALACDRLGAYDRAWAACVAAGEEARRLPVYRQVDLDAMPRRARAMPLVGTAARFAAWAAAPPDDGHPDPVFLVGFPRSGTTMTEQILAAHRRVATLDERPMLEVTGLRAAQWLGQPAPAAVDYDRLTAAQRSALRGVYWAEAARSGAVEGEGKKNVVVDKLPLNLLQLPLIGYLFPGAKIIVALRDPRDVCLSASMQLFQINAAMAHLVSFDAAARFYATVMDAYLAVRPRLVQRWMEVRYEDTTSDLAGSARRLLDFLELEWTDEVLAFHEQAAARSISTPSAAAVAEPIHRKAVSRWKRYEAHVAASLPVLGPFVEAFGYADDG